MPSAVTKDPNAVLDYGVDWTAWLEGDTISSSAWVVAGPDTALAISATKPATADTQRTKVWLVGGTVDAQYTLTNHIVTMAGREDDRTITVSVRQR